MSAGKSEIVKNVVYLLLIIYEIGVFCYWGDEITVQSFNVAQAALETEWTGATSKFRKALILIVARSQIRMQLTAGKFKPLSLEILMAVRNFSTKLCLFNHLDTLTKN